MVVLSERQHVPSPSACIKTFFSLLNHSSLVRDQHFLYAIKTSPQSRIQPVKKWPYLVSQIAFIQLLIAVYFLSKQHRIFHHDLIDMVTRSSEHDMVQHAMGHSIVQEGN